MTTPTTPMKPPPPVMEVPPDIQAMYANMVRIAHTPSELVFDFAHLLPGSGAPRVSARVVMSPVGAKLLQRLLTESILHYEATFGEIKVPGEASLADYLFRPPPAAPPAPPAAPPKDPKEKE